MNFYKLIAIGMGGFIGSIARYIVVKTIDGRMQALFPYGTLMVNFLGSLLLGILYSLTLRKTGMSENWNLFLGVGVCGGFTTFSAFALENFNLLHQKIGISLLYIITSIAAGLIAMAIGFLIGRSL